MSAAVENVVSSETYVSGPLEGVGVVAAPAVDELAAFASELDTLLANERNEVVLNQSLARRFSIFPIQHARIWELHKKQQHCFWLAESIPLDTDLKDFEEKLTPAEQRFVEFLLGFFANSDGAIMKNIMENFLNEVQLPESNHFFAFQLGMEATHAETYGRFIECLVRSDARRRQLHEACVEMPSVKRKIEFLLKYMGGVCGAPTRPFALRQLVFMIAEGIWFQGAFAGVYAFRVRGLLKGFCEGNDYIQRDEGLHFEQAVEVYNLLVGQLSEALVHHVLEEALALERLFLLDAIDGDDSLGLNVDQLMDYVMCCADVLLVAIGFKPKYRKTNPFPKMRSMLGTVSVVNFFECQPTEYQALPPSFASTVDDF